MGIYETIRQLEQMRKKRRIMSVSMIIGAVFFIALFGITPVFGPSAQNYVPLAYLAVSVAIFWVAGKESKLKKEYQALYKSTFVTKVLSEIFQNVHYDWRAGFPSQLVSDMGLCRMGNRFYSEDYLSGSYNGVPFEQADVKVQYHHSGKISHNTTYFEGRMFIFDYPYKQVFSVQAFSQDFNFRCTNPEGFRAKKIEMESEQFNRNFDIYAVQDIDAFYVMTPQMIEKLMAIKNRYPRMAVRFRANKLFVGINCSMKAFDGDIKRPIDYNLERQQTMEDCGVILDIIAALGIPPTEEPDW